MRKMKKLIAVIMSLMLVLLMAACGQAEVQDFGTQTCVYCGNKYHATSENTYVSSNGGYIFMCDNCH